jgi:hypothetical protein
MGRKSISHSQKEQVLFGWLKGLSVREIAREVGVSGGSVSNILRNLKNLDSLLSLFRALVIHLKKDGLDVIKYSDLIACWNYLEREGIDKKQYLL